MTELTSSLSPSVSRTRSINPVPWLLSAPGAYFFSCLIGHATNNDADT